uniref:Uncharacterized protein n=1 Tax=Chromera velia CCMP2878 TaxID=1169474 RepID=A0A0G4GAP0_9ALVE|eukprot:Cvel_4440.t1-p1 / transcript=Cvel_4440.t1 / gene=Cvel_4440 / organism=Chromera_velia_CCMP2878 / gene_product=hypothetical protein / transcript_product=hypothetical protein / location=Cvel_scaffold193:85092-89355(+) / protein_length=381 / sequence_SO=supercontig / SO=protein_coding / is_pseudo=false
MVHATDSMGEFIQSHWEGVSASSIIDVRIVGRTGISELSSPLETSLFVTHSGFSLAWTDPERNVFHECVVDMNINWKSLYEQSNTNMVAPELPWDGLKGPSVDQVRFERILNELSCFHKDYMKHLHYFQYFTLYDKKCGADAEVASLPEPTFKEEDPKTHQTCKLYRMGEPNHCFSFVEQCITVLSAFMDTKKLPPPFKKMDFEIYIEGPPEPLTLSMRSPEFYDAASWERTWRTTIQSFRTEGIQEGDRTLMDAPNPEEDTQANRGDGNDYVKGKIAQGDAFRWTKRDWDFSLQSRFGDGQGSFGTLQKCFKTSSESAYQSLEKSIAQRPQGDFTDLLAKVPESHSELTSTHTTTKLMSGGTQTETVVVTSVVRETKPMS